MEININADDINKMVADAIIKSSLGDHVKEAVERVMATFNRSYDNPLDVMIKNKITEMVGNYLMTVHSEAIREEVKKVVAEKLTGEIIGKIIDTTFYKFMKD